MSFFLVSWVAFRNCIHFSRGYQYWFLPTVIHYMNTTLYLGEICDFIDRQRWTCTSALEGPCIVQP